MYDKNQENTAKLVLAKVYRALYPVILFSMMINILMLVSPLYMLQVYDRVLVSASHSTLLFLTLFAIVALGVLTAFDSIRSVLLARIGGMFDQQLSSEAFKAILMRGDHSQPLRDIEVIRGFISSPSLAAIMDAPWTPIYIGIIYLLNPLLGHLALVGALLIFALALIGEKSTKELQAESSNASNQAFRYTDVCSRQSGAIQAMGMSETLLGKWQEPKEKGLRFHILAAQRSGYITSLSKGIRFSLQVGVLGLGAWLAIEQISTAGVMIAASIIMGRGLAPIEASISGWRQVILAREAKQRLEVYFHKQAKQFEPMQLPTPLGQLSVENIVVQQPEKERPILQNISFQLEAGTVLGITGPNAAGKTTLGKLLIGLIKPSLGDIRLDGASFDQWDKNQLGQHIGYLPQEVELFPGTIAENISRFTEANAEEVVAAAKLAGVHEMILQIDQGYNFSCQNYNETLSGGQRQRIAFARAVFGGPKLILLDEPTSSLDAEAERSVSKALNQLKNLSCTVVVIGHRPALMNVTDKLLVLQQGQMTAYDDTQKVLSKITRQIALPNNG